MPVCERQRWRGQRQGKQERKRKELIGYLMLSLFEDGGAIPMSFESEMGLTTPSMRFLLQSPMLLSEDSLA